jgi:hypothetical protein
MLGSASGALPVRTLGAVLAVHQDIPPGGGRDCDNYPFLYFLYYLELSVVTVI